MKKGIMKKDTEDENMSALRKKAEVCRYLKKDAEEVDRLMEEDGLPHMRLPGDTRPSPRFRLRDVYEWVMAYNKGCVMSFEDFVREFEACQVKGRMINR